MVASEQHSGHENLMSNAISDFWISIFGYQLQMVHV